MKCIAINLLVVLSLCSQLPAQQSPKPAVEAEETVYEYTSPNNGSGPLWCYGSTCIVRHGDDVFVSGQETLKEFQPLNNTRWALYQRTDQGWQSLRADKKDRQREPCPLGVFDDGRLLLSTNPTLTATNAHNGPANPHVLQFSIADLKAPPVALQPVWSKNPGFSEHSYRGLGVDGHNHELVVLNNFGYEEQYWAFLDRRGQWTNRGVIRYPVRGCYEETALVNGACHVLAVGDIMEPVEAGLKWKFEKSGGRHWDYVFRRLFYVWTPAIATTQFSKPLELDNVDQTAGHIMNLDLWIDRDGAAHVLYQKISVHNPALRDKFLPGVPIRTSLEYCVVRDNKIVSRQTLAIGGEGVGGEITGWARFHVTGDGRLFVFYYCSGKDSKGKALDENRLMEILPGGRHTDPVKVGLKHPFVSFMTATVRGGSQPSNILDVLGICQGKSVPTICYARIRL